MAQKNLLREGDIIKHDGQDLKIVKSLSSGLTGEVYSALLSVSGQKDPVPVVIKAMKALDFPLARQLFYKEGETLAFLMHLEEETPDSLIDDLKIAPIYYGLSEYKPEPDALGFPYLVMEVITGTQVPELRKKQGTFSEKQALTIAWHLYRILDILHTRLLKTFIDLKFENLWWLENDSKWGGQLKLTDFGTLEEIKPGDKKNRGLARDVLLGGVYLLSMLTGYTLEYSIGELKEFAKPIIDRFESEITWGTRRLLRKLLHRNIDARFKNASEVLDDLLNLANFWAVSSDELFQLAQTNLVRAENEAEKAKADKDQLSPEGRAAAIRAYSALDILRLQDPRLFNERDIQRVESVLSIGDYFERGYALLQGRSFTLARQTFDEGGRDSDEPAFFRRWAYIAQIGEEIAPADFEERLKYELEPFIKEINSIDSDSQEKWESVIKFCERLADEYLDSEKNQIRPSLASKGLNYLKKESRFFYVLSKANKEFNTRRFGNAAKFFDDAWKILYEDKENSLAFPAETVHQIESDTGIIAVRELNSSLKVDDEDSLETYKKAAESLVNGEMIDKGPLPDGTIVEKYFKAIDLAQEAFSLGRFAPFRFEKLAGLCLTALESGSSQPEKADVYVRASRHFVDIGLQEFGRDVEYDKICDASVKLDLALQKIPLTDHIEFCRLLEGAYAALGEKGALVEGVAVYAAGRTTQEPLFLETLADSIEQLVPSSNHPAEWRRMATEVSQARSAEYRKQVDDLMKQVYHILLPIMPDANDPKTLGEILQVAADHSHCFGCFDLNVLQGRRSRLREANILVDKMRKLIREEGEYRWEEFKSVSNIVTDGLKPAEETVGKQAQVQSEEYKARKDALSGELHQIQEQLNWVKNNPPQDFKSDSQVALYQSFRGQLIDFLYRCYQTKSSFQETSELDILIHQAIHALNMLGVAGWKQLSELAFERIEFFESTFKQANEDFARGDLERVRVVLDSTRTELDRSPEWQALHAVFAQARDWEVWCESKSGLFQSVKIDAGLLRDLRFFTDLDLPAVYWEKSPAGAYLDRAFVNLQSELKSDVKASNVYHPQFVDTLRGLLDITWTMQLVTSDPERREWKKAEWLLGAHELTRSKNARNLLEYIKQTLPPENVEQSLNSFEYVDWENFQQAEMARREARRKTQATTRKFLFAGGIGLAVCFVLAAVGFLGFASNRERLTQFINGTYTPTLTLTPTITHTPTLTPTITLTPTETPTPTPVPPSKFLLSDADSLYPKPPVVGDTYWLINNTDVSLVPLIGTPEPVWQEAVSKDNKTNGEKFVYTITGNTNATWAMDLPFDVAGYYQVFVLDTQEFSSQSQSFSILLDQQSVQPYRGTNQVIFQDDQQKTDSWISVGVYQANAGQTLAVQITLNQLTDQTPFAVDRLLVVRLNESARQMLDQLPSGRLLVSLLDDPTVSFFEFFGGEAKPTRNRGALFTDVPAWNGSLSSRLLDQPTIPIWVEWTPENRLSVGTYEVYVWIPAQHATVVAEYFLLADGREVERPNPALINQNDHSGMWLSLGTWDLLEEAAIGLRMVVDKGVIGEIGVDAVAIVKVIQ